MDHLSKLGDAMLRAIDAGNSPKLVAAILATNHQGKAIKVFHAFAERFLLMFEEQQKRPSRYTQGRCLRAKTALDLIRARIDSTGHRWPSKEAMLCIARDAEFPRIVHRNAA